MAPWIRNVVMLAVMFGWGSFIGTSLIRHEPIPESLWLVPGAVYFAMNPTFKGRSDKDESPKA